MLSDAKIRSAKPRERAYRLSDSQGLCILVQPSGGKLFQVRYRHEGKERTYSIGAYPTISLAEARGERDAVRRKLAHRVSTPSSRDARTVRSSSSTSPLRRLRAHGLRFGRSESPSATRAT